MAHKRHEQDMTAPRLPLCPSRWVSLVSRLPGVTWTCAAVLLLGAALTGALAPKGADDDARRAPSDGTLAKSAPPQANLRVREGTEIVDQLGHFRTTGGRVIFFTDDGKRRYVGLENLNLERIARTLADGPQPLQWRVTGTITEYRGANFLLVRRAILKGGMPSPGRSS